MNAQKKRPTIVAGNWKMYKTIEEALQFIDSFTPAVADSSHLIYLAVPYTAIQAVVEKCQGTNIVVGAQNMNDATEGAFTGEIAGKMLKEVGASFVILGHSERRHIFGETNDFINKKIKRAFSDKIQPIFCIGETLEEREQNQTKEVLSQQLTEGLEGLSEAQLMNIVIAYEPVWAIGTGKTATSKQAEEMHKFCRDFLEKSWNKDVASQIPILYGGSVKPENAGELMEQPNIDGVLVGGASLSSTTFSQIVNFQKINV